MRLFGRRTPPPPRHARTPESVLDAKLRTLVGLTAAVPAPLPDVPDEPYVNGYNDALYMVESYLHGRALGAAGDEDEQEAMLRLRLAVSTFRVKPSDLVDDDDEAEEE